MRQDSGVSGMNSTRNQRQSVVAGFAIAGILASLIALFPGPIDAAASGAANADDGRPRVGLVLSGGGARGAAHIGVLHVLEDLRVPIDYIAGTSMGSIIGGLYAAGMTPDEIEDTLNAMDWVNIFDDRPARETRSFRRKRDDDLYLVKSKPGFNEGRVELPLGAIQGQKFDLALRALTLPVSEIQDFDDLHIPFRAVATDIANGEEVVLGSGDLAQAMRASMAVPGAFAPTRMDGRLLVDGGIANNLPISVVREMGADVVIAVDISTPFLPTEDIRNVLGIAEQLTSILTRKNAEQQLATLTDDDVLLIPQLGDIGTGDFQRAGEAVPTGRAAALEARQTLARLSLDPGAYSRHVAQRMPRLGREPPVIEYVRVDNQSRVGNALILERMNIPLGEPLDRARLEADITAIYGLDLFEIVSYRLEEEDGRTGVIVEARERTWGPNYLQFGLALSSDSRGENSWNLGVGYLRTAINPLGGELRSALQLGAEPLLGGEWFQPLDARSLWFVNPRFRLGRRFITEFSADASERLADYRVDSLQLDVSTGREFASFGEARVGYRLESGDVTVETAGSALPDDTFTDGRIYLRLAADRLDNPNWPTRGQIASLQYAAARTGLGGDSNFDQVTAGYNHFTNFGQNTVGFLSQLNVTVDGEAPLQSRFRVGGFLRLSGFAEDSLSGQHTGSVALLAYRAYKPLPVLSWYLGASLEYGGVWDDRDDIFRDGFAAGSLFLGSDTPIGPLYLGYGQAERGNRSIFVFLGKPF